MRVEKRKPVSVPQHSTSGANDVIELLDLSVQGEQACEQRIAEAQSTGEGPGIEYLDNLRQQYKRAKDTVLAKLRRSGVSDDELRRLAQRARLHPPQV
jgi:hypothetical protein